MVGKTSARIVGKLPPERPTVKTEPVCWSTAFWITLRSSALDSSIEAHLRTLIRDIVLRFAVTCRVCPSYILHLNPCTLAWIVVCCAWRTLSLLAEDEVPLHIHWHLLFLLSTTHCKSATPDRGIRESSVCIGADDSCWQLAHGSLEMKWWLPIQVKCTVNTPCRWEKNESRRWWSASKHGLFSCSFFARWS